MRLTKLICISVTLSLGALPSSPASAQDTTRVSVLGTVLDSRSGLPIEQVEVTLSDLERVILSDEAGAFVLADLPLGTYQMILRKGGYETAEGPLEVFSQGSMVIRMAPISAPSVSTAAGDARPTRIRGVVKELESDEPLQGVLVSIEGVRANQITDEDGRFELPDIQPGTRVLDVSLLGYSSRSDSISVPSGSILTLDVGLSVEPIELDPITVSVEGRSFDLELAGFYERRESTSGLFITQERIKERAPFITSDIFFGLPGIRVLEGKLEWGPRRAVTINASRITSFSGNPEECYPSVWIDGQMVHQGTGGGPAFLDVLIQPTEIAGIEIYSRAASMPAQYNLQSACGVIVIWSKAGGS